MTKRYKYNPRPKGKNNSSAGGLSKKESFYQLFHHIRARCDYPSNKDYERYGGRGIKFRWKDYLSFKEDMHRSYLEHKKKNKTTTLERVDNNGDYCKENCKWATLKEQAKNRRTNRYITYKGKTKTIADWAKDIGCSRQTVRYRLEAGWTPTQIIETKISHANRLR